VSSILTFAVLLGTPLIGALLLGLLGAKRWAPTLNVVFSALTFLAACVLTSRVITYGNLVVMHEQFFIDAFNVFLVTLTAFVGLTTAIFSRPYMRIEAEHGRVSPAQLRLYHSMYQLFMATMLIALTTNNCSGRSCCTSLPREFWAPKASAPCCGRISTS
jgi:hydrogenase-4 component F